MISFILAGMLGLLSEHGFEPPFSQELLPYAVARQQLEDGPNKPVHISAVGLVPGGTNKEVMEKLCPAWYGLKVTTVTAADGQGCYMIEGPRARELGTVSIVLVWDKYATDSRFYFPGHLSDAWKESKNLCMLMKLMKGFSTMWAMGQFNALRENRIKAIEKANSMFGPGGHEINKKLKEK